ncbi:MAG: Ig-like domain-containing protein, partial [Bdellovibrionota bacterium]
MKRHHWWIGLWLFALAGCPLGGTQTGNGADKTPTTVSVRLVSAATGRALGLDRIVPATVRVLGADAGNITDLSGSPASEFDTTTGLAVFAIDEDRIPTPTNPVRLMVLAGGEGLLETSAFVQVDKSGDHVVFLQMVELDELPEGTATAAFDAGNADETGAIENAFRIDTPPDSQAQASAALEIPAGTILTDAAGAPLTGRLTARITFFNNTTPGSLLSFPGGLGVEIAESEEGGPDLDAAFLSGGFLAAEIRDETGKSAKNFSEPVTLSIQMAGGTVNPETAAPVEAGDTIPVWSYETETGKWFFEERGTVAGPNAAGNFQVAFEATHFSYWNLDWKAAVCGDMWAGSGAAPWKLHLARSPATAGLPLSFTVQWSSEYGYLSRTTPIPDDVIDFYRIPRGIPLKFTAQHNGVPVGEMDVTLDASCTPVTMPIDFPPPPVADVPVAVSGNCVPVNRPFDIPGFRYEFWDGSELAAHGVVDGSSGVVEDVPFGTYDVLYWPLGLQITPDPLVLHGVLVDGEQGTVSQTYHMNCETGQPALVKITKFKADPAVIETGESATLRWTSQAANTCEIEEIGPVSVNGTAEVSPLATTTYRLACQGQGPEAKAHVTVKVEPRVFIVSYEASSNLIQEGESVALSWSSVNATTCSINGVGEAPGTGTAEVWPVSDTAYTLVCQAPCGGPVSQVELIDVHYKPVTTDPGPVEVGEDGSVEIVLTGTDVEDPEENLLVQITAGPASGDLDILSGAAPFLVTYTPDPDFFGADEVTFTVMDTEGNTSLPFAVG